MSAHILIIDDNEDILFMLKAMFQFQGYKVTVQDKAENAEAVIRSVCPDLIVMDMLLSGADGRELVKQVKQVPDITHIPVVMISAMPQADQSCLEAGANYFVSKPFEMDVILQTIATALKEYEQ